MFTQKSNNLPNGLAKYMIFMLAKKLVFIGSMLFMNSSLENSVNNLPKNKLKYLPQEFIKKTIRMSKTNKKLFMKYVNSFKIFDETKLPKTEVLYSKSNDKQISDKDYDHHTR